MEPLPGPRVMTRLSKLDLNRGLRCLRRSGSEGDHSLCLGWSVFFQRQRNSEDAHGRHGFRLM